MLDIIYHWIRSLFLPPDEGVGLADEDRLAEIRHKAESNEALRRARDAFIREPVMKQVMPRHESVEL